LNKRLLPTLVALAALVAVTTATAKEKEPGFKTSQTEMVAPVAPGVTADAIITVGETLANGYRFESIPDGISFRKHGQTARVWVNHETSTVPFPAGFNDFTNAMLSELTLNGDTGGILDAAYVIPSSANYQRFCSNFLVGEEHGFDRKLLFTNEEATDFVNRTGTAWPPGPGAEQAGVVVAYDIQKGTYKTIYGMGRHNHENSVGLEAYGHPVVLSGDDTFTSNPAQSQLYSYIAPDADAVWNDTGDLYGFVSDDPAVNDYYDFPVGTSMSVSGKFVKIPKATAVGDQTALENASDALNVFQFVRLEDIAYDRRPGMSNVVYVADTGRGATSPGESAPGVPNKFTSSNGRIWKLVLDPDDPTKVLSLSILVEGDDQQVKIYGEIHQPDNLETTETGLLVTEDPGSSQQFPVNSPDPNATSARLWRVDLLDPSTMAVVTEVDQSLDEGSTDVDPSTTPGNWGAWEQSGIVDVSKVFGPDMFLVDVQAGTLIIEREVRGGIAYEREGGQLLLLHIPGA
jgi:hypothetical protein